MILAIGCAAGAVLFLLAVVLDSRATKRTLAAESTATPPSLYPKINTDVCICAGACVTACPEGDVIGFVDGRPRLIKPSACVGHSDCLRSCPVNAIELVLGTAEQAVEVPAASGTFETSVPGLYVAGEVTGVGLIHNAVAQGRQVAEAALTGIPSDHGLDVDVVIVGSGPAGLAAALEARRRGVSFVVFERDTMGGAIRSYPRNKVVMTSPLDLPGFGKVKLARTTKEALVELF